MAKWPKSTVLVVTGSAVITTHPAWLHSICITATVAGDQFELYEGQDATSGRLVAHFHGPVNTVFHAMYDPPVWCQRGMYVTLAAGIDHAAIHYTPQSLNQPEGD